LSDQQWLTYIGNGDVQSLVKPICLAADQFRQFCLFFFPPFHRSSFPLSPHFCLCLLFLFLGYGVSDTLSLNRAPPGQCRTKSSPIPVSWAAEAGALEFWGMEIFFSLDSGRISAGFGIISVRINSRWREKFGSTSDVRSGRVIAKPCQRITGGPKIATSPRPLPREPE